MASIDAWRTRIKAFLRTDDLSALDPEEMMECIQAAVDEHSLHRPNRKFYDIAGDAGYDYDLPPDWTEGLSEPLTIECPAGNRDRSMLGSDTWAVVWNGAKYQLRLLATTPAVGETIRLEYTTRHTLTNSLDTIRVQDFTAACLLATAWCYASLAARFTGTQDASMSADIVDYRSKGDEYSRLEGKMRKRYFQALGGKADDTGPKPAMVDSDQDPKFANQIDYLTHPRSTR
jgi:hypothetical protein